MNSSESYESKEFKEPNEPIYLVGRNAKNNWDIYKKSDELDTIFHLDNNPSPYVIINKPITELTKNEIIHASELCKSKSKFKDHDKVTVLYTSISNTFLGKVIGSFCIKSISEKYTIDV
jgi:predicted ribosome quality control (RQC) complex YloA/Tae2 family protein